MRVIVFGAGLAGMKTWIALSKISAVEVAAFLDNDPKKRGTSLCGTPVRSADDLVALDYDVVLVASLQAAQICAQLEARGLPPAKFLAVDPAMDLGLQLRSRGLAARDRLALRRAAALRLAIFGSGMAGLRTWESLASRPGIEVVSFLDNSERRQGQRFLGVPIIPPADLDVDDVDAVVVASVGAHDIIPQLLRQGVPLTRLLTSPLLEWLLHTGGDAAVADALNEPREEYLS
jgi:FlaA1/EpsC-like NDP-sugar epimerase